MADPIPHERFRPVLAVPFPERDRAVPRPPVSLTSLIGRSHEIDAIVALLRDGARLVTLTGPGGVGKTRLALEVMHEMAGVHPDGVAFVDLSPLAGSSLILPAIAQALGINDARFLPCVRSKVTGVSRDEAMVRVTVNAD